MSLTSGPPNPGRVAGPPPDRCLGAVAVQDPALPLPGREEVTVTRRRSDL
jgi:hypothetical protein